MKLLIGVDSSKRHGATLDLVSCLGFKDLSVRLATVVPMVESLAWMYPAYSVLNYSEMEECLHSGAKQLLDEAVDDACGRNLTADTVMTTGGKAEGLTAAADQWQADMIAVATGPKGPLDRLLSGSLAQSLAIAAHQSVLVVRGAKRSAGPMRAVFATDHSSYCNRCLSQLLSWQIQGLSHVTAVTAFQASGHHPAIEPDKVPGVLDQVTAKTEEVARRFQDIGIPACGLTVQDDVDTAIKQAMAQADLLILGARGHGFWDRLLLGSVAMHQVGTAPYPVLIVRAPTQVVATE